MQAGSTAPLLKRGCWSSRRGRVRATRVRRCGHHPIGTKVSSSTRLLLMRSGYARVWTLGWHDLEDDAAPPNSFVESRLRQTASSLVVEIRKTASAARIRDAGA